MMRVRPWMRPFLVTPFPQFFTLESCGIFVALTKGRRSTILFTLEPSCCQKAEKKKTN